MPGVLLPRSLHKPVSAGSTTVTTTVKTGTVTLDALLVRPSLSRLVLEGAGGATELVHSTTTREQTAEVGFDGVASLARVYDDRGVLVSEQSIDGRGEVLVPAGGFAVIAQ